MELVLVKANGKWYVMDEEHAYHLLRLSSLKQPSPAVKRYYGTVCYDHAVAECLKTATILEETRDKRAIAVLKQNYKEVY